MRLRGSVRFDQSCGSHRIAQSSAMAARSKAARPPKSTSGDRLFYIPLIILIAVPLTGLAWFATSRRHRSSAEGGGNTLSRMAGNRRMVADGSDQNVAAYNHVVHAVVSDSGSNPISSSIGGLSSVHGEPEIWARGPNQTSQSSSFTEERRKALAALIGQDKVDALKALCGRCLYRTLSSYVRMHDFGRIAIVLTGEGGLPGPVKTRGLSL